MDKKFIKFADLPPNPFDDEDLRDYKELGMNVCLLTEDDVKMVADGNLSDAYQQAIQNIGKAGMNVWIRNMFNDCDYFQCESHKESTNYGDRYEMAPRNITTEFAKFPFVTGFYMADEAYMETLPNPPQVAWMQLMPRMADSYQFASFDKLVKLVDWKNQYYPNAFFHMNHVPGQCWDHYLPKDGIIYDYEDFLTTYCDVILRRLKGCGRSLCLDNYPLIGEDYIEKDYLQDLFIASKVTRTYNASVGEDDKATFGICIQTFEAKSMFDERRRDIVAPEEVTFQMYTGMALGARLFEFFGYHSFENEFVAIKGPDKEKRIYDHVQEANTRATQFEDVLCEFDSQGGFVVWGEECTENTAAFVLLRKLVMKDDNVSVKASHDTLVGCFERNGQKGYMLVNYTDPIRRHDNLITVTFNGGESAKIYQAGNMKEVVLNNEEMTITLKPGDAAFIIPKIKG